MVKLNVFFHLILLMQLRNAIMPQGEIYFHDDRSRIYHEQSRFYYERLRFFWWQVKTLLWAIESFWWQVEILLWTVEIFLMTGRDFHDIFYFEQSRLLGQAKILLWTVEVFRMTGQDLHDGVFRFWFWFSCFGITLTHWQKCQKLVF